MAWIVIDAEGGPLTDADGTINHASSGGAVRKWLIRPNQ
jgi:hypothetical protein